MFKNFTNECCKLQLRVHIVIVRDVCARIEIERLKHTLQDLGTVLGWG